MADKQYDSNLTGVLFKNDKDGNEKRPDYKGSAEIEGVQYWVSAWIRDGAKGKFMSMKYEAKEKPNKVRRLNPRQLMSSMTALIFRSDLTD